MHTVLALIAHQGGWDEILLVGAPIVVIVGMLAVAKRRVDAVADDTADEPVAVAEADRPSTRPPPS